MVPFPDATISILAAEHLVAWKAVFDRPRDWVDIDAVLADGAGLDVAEVLRWVEAGIVVGGDPAERLALVLTRR